MFQSENELFFPEFKKIQLQDSKSNSTDKKELKNNINKGNFNEI